VNSSSVQQSSTRFHAIDGIRGIAAVSVVLYHLAGAVDRAAAGEWMPSWIRLLVAHGYLGVDLFFVLSGFVIAYSTRNGDYTWGYLGRFALRRSIRLDPPYWFTILAEVVVVALTLRFFDSLSPELPSLSRIAAHMLYLQNILQLGDILPIFWTLCYEIQFYLLFVVLLVLWQRMGKTKGFLPFAVLGFLFLVSLAVRFSSLNAPFPGLAIDRWFQFFLGVLAWWTVSRGTRVAVLVLACASTVIAAYVGGAGSEQLVGITGCSVIAYAGLKNKMAFWLSGQTMQFLGRISYSLYLIHLIVGWRFVALADELLPPLSPLGAFLLFGTGVVVSIVAAAVLWRFVEQPTIKLSKKVNPPSGRGPKPSEARVEHAIVIT
jgi:peptidoglycan/LPS O-acetylase OafA/YrhL